jgi:hypothetical protein
MMRFEWNKKAIGEIKEGTAAALRDTANEVARTHSGRSKTTVRGALKAAAKRRGLRFEPGDDMVDAISKGTSVRFR